MVVISAGTLSVGTLDAETAPLENVEPPHTVAIARALAVGRFEVTKVQFAYFVQQTRYPAGDSCFAWNGGKYARDPTKDWRNPGFAQKDSEPVVCINWYDAKAYANWLAKKTGKPYRLLTGEEWEYAARAGKKEVWPWGDSEAGACDYANVADAATKRGVPGTNFWKFHGCDDGHAYTAPVGSYPPNAFGLYDMIGNVWEWTEDCVVDADVPPVVTGADKPAGECAQRVLRGGSWVDSPFFVRYDFRFRLNANDRDFYAGFRVARPR